MKSSDVKVLLEKAILHSTVTSKAVRPIINALQVITEFSSSESEAGSSNSHQASLGGAAGGDEAEHVFGTLTKTTMSVYYRSTFLCLGKLLKQMALEKKILSSSEEKLAKLAACTKLNSAVKQLIELVKAKKSPIQLKASALREGKTYLELMQRSMPFFGHMAALESKKTVECLKQIEDGSRILQRLCNQAKEEGAVSLLLLIPGAKKCIEKLVIETCRIVESAGLSGALRFGPLKHKNLKGDVMSSQVSYRGADQQEEEEEVEKGEEEDNGGDKADQVDKGAEEEEEHQEDAEDYEVANSDE
jgi:Fanconi anemia group D2 protein